MIRVEHGDCLAVMAAMAAEGVQVDAVVTDPPYGIGFMGRSWDAPENVAFRPETWRLVFDLLKPGGHMFAFGGTRTYHRMVCAIEDAGFEIRDQFAWVYGSGFPKSHDVSKAIDRRRDWSLVERLADEIKRARNLAGMSLKDIGIAMQEATGGQYGAWYHRGGHMFFETGMSLPSRPEWECLRQVLPISEEFYSVYDEAERAVLGTRHDGGSRNVAILGTKPKDYNITAPATEAAKQWQGWGSAVKPAWEPIVLARKPLSDPTIAANVLKHGTGALNIDATRVGNVGGGRFPANLVHDGSEEVLEAFARFGERPSTEARSRGKSYASAAESDGNLFGHRKQGPLYSDTGTAARFFYCAKASKADRSGSKHPTVKPVSLIRWLVRMITPPGGVVLDPFAGSGTTGAAALAEGMRAILIEREAAYVEDIRRRLDAAPKQPALAL